VAQPLPLRHPRYKDFVTARKHYSEESRGTGVTKNPSDCPIARSSPISGAS